MAHMRMTSKGGKPQGDKHSDRRDRQSHDGRFAYHSATPASPRKKESDDSLQAKFLKAAFQPFTGIAERSLPAKQKDEILSLFSQAWKNRKDPAIAEGKLLEAMNILPENPFIATRLVCFFKGIGKDRDALEMAQKAQNLAARQNIKPEYLLG